MIVRTGIPLYRLMVARSAINLEIKGMKMSRGISWTAVMKAELGVKGNREKVLAAVEKAIKQAEANLVPGDIRAI